MTCQTSSLFIHGLLNTNLYYGKFLIVIFKRISPTKEKRRNSKGINFDIHMALNDRKT